MLIKKEDTNKRKIYHSGVKDEHILLNPPYLFKVSLTRVDSWSNFKQTKYWVSYQNSTTKNLKLVEGFRFTWSFFDFGCTKAKGKNSVNIFTEEVEIVCSVRNSRIEYRVICDDECATWSKKFECFFYQIDSSFCWAFMKLDTKAES